MGLLQKLKRGLEKTRQRFRGLLSVDDLGKLEVALLAADVGVRATTMLLERVRSAARDRQAVLQAEIARILGKSSVFPSTDAVKPQVVLIVGVNGSGKTTTVGKLCHYLALRGERVVVAAADTYRDAAADQLAVWVNRVGVEVVMSQRRQDAAAVVFDAITKAKAGGFTVVLVDTAGRLHTRDDLMAELLKIKRVCAKALGGAAGRSAPHEVWLVLDATVGQNGIRQAQAFNEALGLTGVVVTKLDGTAKGGVLIPISLELNLPVRFIGIGEGLEDLQEFDGAEFARALFEE